LKAILIKKKYFQAAFTAKSRFTDTSQIFSWTAKTCRQDKIGFPSSFRKQLHRIGTRGQFFKGGLGRNLEPSRNLPRRHI
jgi:hypothetical protein